MPFLPFLLFKMQVFKVKIMILFVTFVALKIFVNFSLNFICYILVILQYGKVHSYVKVNSAGSNGVKDFQGPYITRAICHRDW